jgi:hypothetical protein
MHAIKKAAAPEATGRDGKQLEPQPSYTAAKHLGKYREWKSHEVSKDARTSLSRYQLVARFRLAEIKRLLCKRLAEKQQRYLPDDDDGADTLVLVLNVAAFVSDEKMRGVVLRFAPWLSDDEAAALIESVKAEPRWHTADELAWRLRVTMFERDELSIKTIGCYEMSSEVRKRFRRRRWNSKRRKNRPTISASKPWEAEGISRATWYRRGSVRQKARQ